VHLVLMSFHDLQVKALVYCTAKAWRGT
jgi:hypothetical protein